jgi:hypothetical protein
VAHFPTKLGATPADWIERVRRLALDPELGQRLGGGDLRTVEGYSVRMQTLRMGQALREAAAS